MWQAKYCLLSLDGRNHGPRGMKLLSPHEGTGSDILASWSHRKISTPTGQVGGTPEQATVNYAQPGERLTGFAVLAANVVQGQLL
jgi:hypothetical protein